ncbi:MAG: tryptophan 7-halogenase [Rhodospirillales bacterium]|nr:tryptophan 7-halogenase [Rhodospirillales bacterium]
MKTEPGKFDVVVLGGGPAGVITAIGLAELHHRVVLVTWPHPHLRLEGFSQRVTEALHHRGCRHALGTVGPEVERIVAWNGETTAVNREYVVDRGAFDKALLTDAEERGVVVMRRRVRKLESETGRWTVVTGAAGSHQDVIEADFVVEARGRRAPAGRMARVQGPTTLAIAGRRSDRLNRARSCVASLADGWAWLIAPGDGTAVIQLIVAGGGEAHPKRDELQPFFAERVAALAKAEEWFSGTEVDGPVFARHATPVMGSASVADNVLRVGDAAAAVDPLSGHGVFEAIGSAIAAVPVINTMRTRPQDGELAKMFYGERVRDTFLRYARAGRMFYAAEQRWPDGPFWAERCLWPDERPAHEPAFSAPPRTIERPAIEDGFVVRRPVVVTPDHPRGIWQVAGVPLVRLLRFLEGRRGDRREDVITAAAAFLERPAEGVKTACDWLSSRKLLLWERENTA